MKFKQILAVLGLSFFGFIGSGQSTQITIKSELSSPIVLEDEQTPNYLKVSLIGSEQKQQSRVPINLALVIDRSGSMSGDRIEKAREAAIMAINMLNENDIVSVIAYDDNAEVVIPSTKVKDKQALIKIINNKINANGMTALFAGLSKGINQVDKYLDKEKVNRVILLSDGEANIGPTSVGELSELAIIAAKKGIAVTTVGIGRGYNEVLMASIASYSDGNHAFVQNSADLETVFIREFKDVMSVIAQEVIVTITLPEGVRPIRLLGRTGEINQNLVKVKMNQLYSNQEKYVLLELVPEKGTANKQKTIASVDVEYDDLINKKTITHNDRVSIAYTNQPQIVKQAIIEEVLVESEIQKVALDNEKVLELYKNGEIEKAKKMMKDTSTNFSLMSSDIGSAKTSARISTQMEKNQIMLDAIEDDDADIYRKKATELQFESKQNSIKQK